MRRVNQKTFQRNRVLAAMFDVRPMTEMGDLDMEKVNQVTAVLNLKEVKTRQGTQQREGVLKIIEPSFVWPAPLDNEYLTGLEEELEEKEYPLPRPKEEFPEEKTLPTEEALPTKEEILVELAKIDEEEQIIKTAGSQSISLNPVRNTISNGVDDWLLPCTTFVPKVVKRGYPAPLLEPKVVQGLDLWLTQPEEKELKEEKVFKLEKLTEPEIKLKSWPKSLVTFLMAGFLISLLIPVLGWLNQGWQAKERITASGLAAYENLLTAQESLKQTDFQRAEQDFNLAYGNFLEANEEIKNLGQLTINILEQLPGGSLISSGAHLVKVGQNLAQAGQNLMAAINLFSFNVGHSVSHINVGDRVSHIETPLTDSISLSQEKLNQSFQAITLAHQELEQVEIETLPVELQEKTLLLKEKLPLVEEMLGQFLVYTNALLKILGHDNPSQYLLLFQNNSEMRATGGFIGTYGLLTLDQGQIKKLFIDGVFNADGQLQEKIIPPQPIQKISTAWSMHDANWFADFPSSAQKVAWFYEKTGGPTVDGVIALTSVVIERLLKLTGPIEMPEYEVTLSPENFVELIQYKVEVDYDKELNQPKKILADFAPKFIQALADLSLEKQKQALEIIFDCLKERHILIYFHDDDLEDLMVEQGWAGQILETEKDYLNVVSSNINGYKTDRVVEETIEHQAEIQEDGSIIDTLTITRQHQGGGLEYDWWNRVNANYLRVYLPQGSQLLSSQGQTLEVYLPPIDYAEHGFKPDPLVKSIEEQMVIDQKTGTHIFEESGKTVFGNWVYVSPGQTVKIIYQYKLPFKIDLTKASDSYSLLVQKQAGSLGSQFRNAIKFPENWQVVWQYPEEFQVSSFHPADDQPKAGKFQVSSDLKIDRFFGLTFEF